MIIALLIAAMLINTAYCTRKILDDLKIGNRGLAAIGLASVITLNGAIIWLVYLVLASMTAL